MTPFEDSDKAEMAWSLTGDKAGFKSMLFLSFVRFGVLRRSECFDIDQKKKKHHVTVGIK